MPDQPDDRGRLVSRWIGELVADHGSQAETARRLGVNGSTVTRWLGGGSVDLDNLVRIADLSGHTLGDMMVAYYGVTTDQLTPTAPEVRMAGKMIGPDGRLQSQGSYRLVFMLPAS